MGPGASQDAVKKRKLLPLPEFEPRTVSITIELLQAHIKKLMLAIKMQMFLDLLYSLQKVHAYISFRSTLVSNSTQEMHSISGGTEESRVKSVAKLTSVSLPDFHHKFAFPIYLAVVPIGTQPYVFIP
jgi:hypothetical protein